MENSEVEVKVSVGGFFEARLDSSLSGSTGYVWVLAVMPETVNLVDVREESTSSAMIGRKSELVYVFVAVKEGASMLKFNKIRPTLPQTSVDTMEFALTIGPGAMTREQELEAMLGGCKFIETNQLRQVSAITALYMAPRCGSSATASVAVPPYGFPLKVVHSPEQCLLAYGTPDGIAKTAEQCILKYGFPVDHLPKSEHCTVEYGFPVVKYGFVVQGAAESGALALDYGFPTVGEGSEILLTGDKENCLVRQGCPVEIVEDRGGCIVKYGAPPRESKAQQPEHETCLLKYGMPVQVREAGKGEMCHVMYGFVNGMAETMEECVIKYGVPVAAERHPSCLVKYGFPPDAPK